MRFVRYGEPGRERPGVCAADGSIRDLGQLLRDITPATIADGSLDRLRSLDVSAMPKVAAGVRLASPVDQVGKIVCVGLNYRAHAAESSMQVPTEPVVFMKATSAITGPNDPLVLPPGAAKGDWEVELGVVIGRTARAVSVADAPQFIAGFCLANDFSERAFQLERGGQWAKGKSYDTFAPLGPWLVTADEVSDPQALDIWLDVNGERMQSSNTARMIFPVHMLVSYISEFMTLNAGDVILTGTPEGVGLGCTPPRFLAPGDEVHFGVAGLGEQRHRVVGAQRVV